MAEYKKNNLRTARETLHKLENSGILENNLSMEQITAIRIAEFALDELCKLKDAQPVKCGRWEYYKNNGIIDTYICTNCQGKVEMAIDVDPIKFKYCPNCGARMDGDSE